MLSHLAALTAAIAQPNSTARAPTLGRTAWIFSTIGHSEWCPAGNVRMDLRTGEYFVTSRAARQVCHQPGLERPVRRSRLAGDRLTALRAAYLRVLSEGVENRACREGGQPQEIVISNGGTPILVLTTGRFTAIAPDELTCWSDAANALHDALDHVFSPEDYRRRR